MFNKTAFINCDYLPPTSERFCLIPETVIKQGYEAVCIRIIDNYPWSFDCRMKSDTAYDEKVIDFLSVKCRTLGLKLLLVFPGENDYCRLLRLNGYKRLVDPKSSLLKINTEAVGFASLIESISEDFTSLCPDLYSVVLESGSENNIYNLRAGDIIDRSGCRLINLKDYSRFSTANFFIDGAESALEQTFLILQESQNSFSNALFSLSRLLTMSSLGSSMPAADRRSLNIRYSELIELRRVVEFSVEEFGKISSGKIEEEWLAIFIKSILLTVDANCEVIRQRLILAGLLN